MIDFTNTKDLTIEKKDVVTLFIDGKLAWENAKGGDWLCFTAEQADSTVHLDKKSSPDAISLETSTDGSTWTDYSWTDSTGDTLTLANVGDKVYMRAKGENPTIGTSNINYYKFVMTGKIAASGNIQKLLKADGSRTDAPDYCYTHLFDGCTALTQAPALPATTLASGCYASMFYGCSSLTTAPELPVTTLAGNCYAMMFNGCTSLTTAPALPATTLADNCYSNMFVNCKSLTSVTLPATTLAERCYYMMLRSCSNLHTITLGYTGNFADAPNLAFSGWVMMIASTGTFYYNGTDTTTGANAIPAGWTVTPFTP